MIAAHHQGGHTRRLHPRELAADQVERVLDIGQVDRGVAEIRDAGGVKRCNPRRLIDHADHG